MSTRLLGAFHLYEWWKREFVWPVFHSYVMILFKWPYELLCTEELSIMLIFFTLPNVRENKRYQVDNNTQVFLHNLVENWIHFLLMFRDFFALCLAILKQSRHVLFLHVTFVWCYIKSFNNTLLKGKACYVCVAKKPICIEHKKSMIWFLFFVVQLLHGENSLL